MVFTSHIFVFFFLPLVLVIYYLLPAKRTLLRNPALLCASYLFYAWLNPWFAALLLAATLVNYLFGKLIAKSGPKVTFVVLSVAVNICILAFFKYFVFARNNLNHLLSIFGAGALPVFQVVLPVGVSFYIFRVIAYCIDVYRGLSPARLFVDFACYVSFFPQLLSGPIQRYATIDPKSRQLPSFANQLVHRTHTLEKFSTGAAMFILGFAKKVLLANVIARCADAVFAAEAPCALDAWFGALAYTFQLYIDFSAYSEMAIGLGLMLGFECPKNFNAPYRADSITDFWRRWHISLSSWFRDYLYIPLGGSRTTPARSYLNLVIVFLLCGLWHGANWTFIIWGTYHGVLLVFERRLGRKTLYASLPQPLRIMLTFMLLMLGWVFFRSGSISEAFAFFAAMSGAAAGQGGSVLLAAQIYTQANLIIMAVAAILIFQPIQAFDWAGKITWPGIILLTVLFCLSLMTMFTQSFTSFLYFQF